jgi:hypothetical protein
LETNVGNTTILLIVYFVSQAGLATKTEVGFAAFIERYILDWEPKLVVERRLGIHQGRWIP